MLQVVDSDEVIDIRELWHPDDDLQPSGEAACIPMATGLAHLYTEAGLVVAADGFNYYRFGPGPDVLTVESTKAQKIYAFDGFDRCLSCAFYGRVTLSDDNDEKVFNFVTACHDSMRELANVRMKDANELARNLAPKVFSLLEETKRSGRLDRYPNTRREFGKRGRPLARVFIDGCFGSKFYRSGIRFFHDEQKLDWDFAMEHRLELGVVNRFYGSDEIYRCLFRTDDSRLEKYRSSATRAFKETEPLSSIDAAVQVATDFIGACSDPVAREIEGINFQRIGGELHVATIKASEGFQWVKHPTEFDEL